MTSTNLNTLLIVGFDNSELKSMHHSRWDKFTSDVCTIPFKTKS